MRLFWAIPLLLTGCAGGVPVAVAPPPAPALAPPTCAQYLACRADALKRNLGAAWCDYYVPEWSIVYQGKVIGTAISCTPDGSGEKVPVI